VLPVPTVSPGSIGGGADMRIGPDNTMYLMYQKGDALVLRSSRNFGTTWTRERAVTAPGVVHVSQWALASGRSGEVSVAYLGQRTGQTTWDGYVTATHTATAASPVFWSARVNSATRPLLYGDSVQGAGYLTLPRGQHAPFPPPFDNHSTGNDFIGATFDFAGSAWGSFTQDCGPTPSSAGCAATNDQTRGYAGYLRWPIPAPGLPHSG
jgi:hypothetical protein